MEIIKQEMIKPIKAIGADNKMLGGGSEGGNKKWQTIASIKLSN